MEKVKIANISIDNITVAELLENLQRGVVFTPNADHVMRLQKDKAFYEIYQDAEFVVCDSKIIQVASRFLGTPIIEKISGSDLFPAFYKYHGSNADISIFLLGSAEQSIVELAQVKINQN